MPDVANSAFSPELTATFAAVQAHFRQVIVPLWQGPGWNAELALPYEALSPAHQPLPPQRYRAMACARQLYVFASLIDDPAFPAAAERAAALFRSLQSHFHDAEHGGWFYSIDPHGAPLDQRKDLYTHAFIIFACAHYWAKVREPLVESVLNAALQVVLEQFSTGNGLYEATLDQDWSSLGSGPLQNPLMHLAEAFLATLSVREDPTVQSALLALTDGMQQHFIEPVHNVMLEKPRGAVDNWFEPGHQFEWLFLLASSPLLRGTALHGSLDRAFGFAEQVGVDPQTGAVCGMLAPDGTLRDGTQRIWAQAEYLRALTLRPEGAERVQRQLLALQQRFLYTGGWYECRDGQGNVSREDMPSTTPYHLATCYSGLAQYFER
ncbi:MULTISPECIES: AGE family epimerase/isomerase [unclassified Pseudomonas]|uniref:AGE family epimerase/isomerase n=1 Tax=unclassified Pseudomonas TaxID=196821 RepID=UPI0012965953|nr:MULTISPECIES: AGE family epimerase/isomerase [unclassified Pseudomonas]MQT43428.1 N-acylglucosamine 2-epimerase [Pseudomonas sp. FSL R10-0765]MQT52533.1 N-acylglucosamine 2-epimerase [Pseudomonas sp. FSL R10-2398]MQU01513.1 N-acylglucosamine 2-epimerase [Pseudomonas sp. FSL R10-2245]MQU13320.1 N-acylglucosamine 2-epimerase [Pseudomonas sp. FSL R10-2189]MQU39561.1 N-acylglucosamine 2-epimerase [Pseudomonas sp. FSL R10-2172]